MTSSGRPSALASPQQTAKPELTAPKRLDPTKPNKFRTHDCRVRASRKCLIVAPRQPIGRTEFWFVSRAGLFGRQPTGDLGAAIVCAAGACAPT
jgi:hypothetical protein